LPAYQAAIPSLSLCSSDSNYGSTEPLLFGACRLGAFNPAEIRMELNLKTKARRAMRIGPGANLPCMELGRGPQVVSIPILYEDRSILAIDKPAGWMLIPFSWQKTNRNLQAAITSSIAAGDFWARSRNLRFLRFIHRLDGETTGVLLFAKSRGAIDVYGRLFESRQIRKTYFAVVQGVPAKPQWTCTLKLAPRPGSPGEMCVDERRGKESETNFRLLETSRNRSLLEAEPLTGRTHQIRVHLAEGGTPIVGDALYGSQHRRSVSATFPMGLRAIRVEYADPFTKRLVKIEALPDAFVEAFGFASATTGSRAS
jgi:RluA family pseudouridine synthase